MAETLKERITRERREFECRPWQLAPSEVADAPAPSPWPRGTAAHDAWHEAQKWRAELRAANPDYFTR